MKNGEVVETNSNLIPIFSDVIKPNKEMSDLINNIRSPYEKECNRVIGKTEGLLYRRGNFNGTWDDVICEAIIEERDVEISLSPGFRWGTTLLPGQNITIDDMYSQTSMNYPEVYRIEMTGKMIKDLLEDVCDNIFNTDPFFQQGGDMVRVGGLTYTCSPKNQIGKRINDLRVISKDQLLDPNKKYVVGGWGSVRENVNGPPIYDLLEKYISHKKIIRSNNVQTVKILGM